METTTISPSTDTINSTYSALAGAMVVPSVDATTEVFNGVLPGSSRHLREDGP